jgi:thiol-disulfide isomerase/thioredoxin
MGMSSAMNWARRMGLVTMLLLAAPLGAAGFRRGMRFPPRPLRARPGWSGKHLADYRGKVVLLNFWASWCPPCLREMPSMERLRVKMQGRPLEIVALDSAEPVGGGECLPGDHEAGFSDPARPDGVITKNWKVFALPTSFMLDAQGRIRYSLSGPVEWDEGEALQIVESLLAELPDTQDKTGKPPNP